jgi:hypothetical protein
MIIPIDCNPMCVPGYVVMIVSNLDWIIIVRGGLIMSQRHRRSRDLLRQLGLTPTEFALACFLLTRSDRA